MEHLDDAAIQQEAVTLVGSQQLPRSPPRQPHRTATIINDPVIISDPPLTIATPSPSPYSSNPIAVRFYNGQMFPDAYAARQFAYNHDLVRNKRLV